MKRLFTFFALILMTSAKSQDSSRIEQYCEVVATSVAFSNKVAVEVDYGDAVYSWRPKRLKDEEGKVKKFNTIIDALNYFGKQGWKLVNAFPVTPATGSQTYHYVLKKEFNRVETE